MGITVREALAIPPLDRAQVLAGAGGLGRLVEGVSVMDSPDASDWMKGNELVLTTGYLAKEDPQVLCGLVQGLIDKQVAAVAFHLHRWMQELPAAVLALAEAAQVPLLRVPSDAAWLDIIYPVMGEVFNRQSQRVRQHLSQVVLAGGGGEGVVLALTDLLGCACALFDGGRRLSAFAAPAGSAVTRELAELWGPTQLNAEAGREPIARSLTGLWRLPAGYQLPAAIGAPIGGGREGHGTLLTWQEGAALGQVGVMTLEQGAMVLAMEVQRQQALAAMELRYRDEFLIDLLFGHFTRPEEMAHRGRLYGLDLSQCRSVLVADLDQPPVREKREQVLAAATWTLRTLPEARTWVILDDRLVVLAGGDDGAYRIGVTLQGEVARVVPGAALTVGCGSDAGEPAEIPRSFNEARQALRLGLLLWGGDRCFRYSDLGVYRLLLAGREAADLAGFKAQVLGALEAYDGQTGSQLADTLERYLETDCSLQATAGAMHVHVNTVKYRLGRVRRILKMELESTENRLQLLVALKIRRLLQSGQSLPL